MHVTISVPRGSILLRLVEVRSISKLAPSSRLTNFARAPLYSQYAISTFCCSPLVHVDVELAVWRRIPEGYAILGENIFTYEVKDPVHTQQPCVRSPHQASVVFYSEGHSVNDL